MPNDLLHPPEPDPQRDATDKELLVTVEEWEEEGYTEAQKMRVRRGDIFETRLKASKHLRGLANEHFKRGDTEAALFAYDRAWYHADFDTGFIKLEMTDHHQEELFKVTVPIRFNLAQCLMSKRAKLIADKAAAAEAANAAAEAERKREEKEAKKKNKGKAKAPEPADDAPPPEDAAPEDVAPESDDADDVEEVPEHAEDKPPEREFLSEARAHIDTALESLENFEDLTAQWKGKGLYLRSKCKLEVGLYDDCAKDLAEAIRLAPNDKTLRQALDDVRALKKETKDAEKQMMDGKLGPVKSKSKCVIS